jgi:hypothetical protein
VKQQAAKEVRSGERAMLPGFVHPAFTVPVVQNWFSASSERELLMESTVRRSVSLPSAYRDTVGAAAAEQEELVVAGWGEVPPERPVRPLGSIGLAIRASPPVKSLPLPPIATASAS